MAVTQRDVAAAIADGAHSREAVTRACRAGGDCGACHGMIEDMIEDHLEDCAIAAMAASPEQSGPIHVASCSGSPPASSDQLVPESALVRAPVRHRAA